MFIDAQKKHEESPDTFQAHHIEDLQALVGPGDYVKVCHEDPGERFWVRVDKVDGALITGRVANELLMTPLAYNEVIQFEHRHIYDYLPEGAEMTYDEASNINYVCEGCNERRS